MTSYIKTHTQGSIGVIELDRPKALNSLDLDMINAIDEALATWSTDGSIDSVVLRSTSSRAFCAGGDVRAIADYDAAGDYAVGDEFFKVEYKLNNKMAEYNKPIVSLLEGVTMGGGFGISAHGSHRVVTSSSLGAMPEAAIGFSPDVGMTYRLTHLQSPSGGSSSIVDASALGVFLGTTGWRMGAADMLELGVATNLVDDIDGFADALGGSSLVEALDKFSLDPRANLSERSHIVANADLINDVFSGESWQDIASRLGQQNPKDEQQKKFVDEVETALAKANPTSLVAIVEIFRHNAHTDLPTALDNELTVGGKLRRQPNFPEGVRAVLVDKDQPPNFDPADSAQVDPDEWRSLLK